MSTGVRYGRGCPSGSTGMGRGRVCWIKNMFLSQKGQKKVPAQHGSPMDPTGPVRASPPHPSQPSDPAVARPHLPPTFVPRHPSNSLASSLTDMRSPQNHTPHVNQLLNPRGFSAPFGAPEAPNAHLVQEFPPPHNGEAQQPKQFASIKENEKKTHAATEERIANL
jgi:hypothetical protein